LSPDQRTAIVSEGVLRVISCASNSFTASGPMKNKSNNNLYILLMVIIKHRLNNNNKINIYVVIPPLKKEVLQESCLPGPQFLLAVI